jgi:hypothetical protein
VSYIKADKSNHESRAQDIVRDIIPPYPHMGFDDLRHLLYYDDTSGGRCYIVCRDQPPKKGGPVLVVIRFSALGFGKVVSPYFRLSEEGWVNAWKALAAVDPQEFESLRKRVVREGGKYERQRQDHKLRQDAERNTHALLEDSTFLGGYTPCASLTTQHAYDLRFMTDSLQIFEAGTLRQLGGLSYDSFTDIQITGPGLTRSTNPFVDPAGKFIGAAIRSTQLGINENLLDAAGNAISDVLKTIGTRSSIKTVLFAQTTDSELFFLYTRTDPEQLRIDLSPVLGRIREAVSSLKVDRPSDNSPDATSIIAQLKDASMLLDRGLITQAEFEWLKSRLLPRD